MAPGKVIEILSMKDIAPYIFLPYGLPVLVEKNFHDKVLVNNWI